MFIKRLIKKYERHSRGGSRTAATSKMEHFVIIVNGFQTLTIITKRSILNGAVVLDPPLHSLPSHTQDDIFFQTLPSLAAYALYMQMFP